MFWIILCITIGACFAINNSDSLGELIGFSTISILLSVLTGAVIFTVVSCLFDFPTKGVLRTTEEIYALNDTTNNEGNSFLFSGYVDEKYIYRYVTKGEKGLQIKELENDGRVYIQEDDSNPRIENYTVEFETENKLRDFFVFPPELDYTIIYIPKGSVIIEYNINLN